MEDQANVEVEKGEYVTQPGEAPMEAMGQKHADGGTPVSLEQGTKVITDDTTIEPDFAKYIFNLAHFILFLNSFPFGHCNLHSSPQAEQLGLIPGTPLPPYGQ